MAEQEGPPGYDPESDAKPKTKSAKRNARKKEKRLQVIDLIDSLCVSIFFLIKVVQKTDWVVQL